MRTGKRRKPRNGDREIREGEMEREEEKSGFGAGLDFDFEEPAESPAVDVEPADVDPRDIDPRSIGGDEAGNLPSDGKGEGGSRRRRRRRRRGGGGGDGERNERQSSQPQSLDENEESRDEEERPKNRNEGRRERGSRDNRGRGERGERGSRRERSDRKERTDSQRGRSRSEEDSDTSPRDEESGRDRPRRRERSERGEKSRGSRGEKSRRERPSRESAESAKSVKKEMLINAAQTEECRIAILEDGVLEELYTERASADNYVGNIYKGKVVNLEPSIQAAFVDFGVGKNGFLHISDVEPQYYRQGGFEPNDNFGPDGKQISAEEAKKREQGRRHRFSSRPRFKPPIQEIFQRGDEVVVQVIKEGIGNKGPTLSTYVSIPGRYLVLMPALGRVGVSRKIEDDDDRRRLRDIMLDLNPPKGLGFIVRTAGEGRTRRDLSRDLSYLLRLWKVISRRIEKKPAPVDIYEESDMMIRTIRDILTKDVDSITIDDAPAFERAKEFLDMVMPRFVDKLSHYDGAEPLFHKYGVEKEIANIHCREVKLKNGGSIVVDQTEALVAIDVNSGSFRTDDSAEDTAYQMNLAAAKEIARQLRLRDLGGVIVNDFIDMRKERHRRNLERALRDSVARDRARTKILRTSPFGLVEMTRQRIRPSLKRSVYRDCPCCNGRGMVKTAESMAIEVIRTLYLATQKPEITQVTIRVNDEVAAYLNNKKRREIAEMEEAGSMVVQILGDKGLFPESIEMHCKDENGREVFVPTP